MNSLYELINLLPSTFKPMFSKQLNELFFFLKKNQRLNEEEVRRQFFKTDQRVKQFNKLKHKLKKQLINHLMVNPTVWADTAKKELCDTFFKDFTAYKILLTSGKTVTAMEIGNKLLLVARKLEFHALVFEIASDLQFYYSSIKLALRLSKKYGKIAKESSQLVSAEAIVRSHHSQVSFLCNAKASFSASAIETCKIAAREVIPFLNLGSQKLGRLIYNIVVARYYATQEYQEIINWCDKALNYFSEDHPNIIAFKFSFMQKKLPALVALASYDEAKVLAREACQMVPPGSFNWHLIFIQRLTVCLHAGDYQEAYDLYKAHIRYGCKYEALTEYWIIFRGYLYFLIQIGRIEPYVEERFNVGKFLNEVPIYSKDKRGNNINILLLQILIRMQREQFGKIIDQVESLSAYARKYTRNPETIRANIFINMIVRMEAASFHRVAVERKTKRLLEKLNKTPIYFGQNLAVEIMPYEVLWAEMLKMLEDKFRAKTIKKENIRNK